MLIGGGDDDLQGVAGADFLDGGLGNDIYVVDNIADKITDTDGVDTVRTTLLSYALAAGLENLTYLGSGSFSGKGSAAANVITGGDGSDRLESVGGNDTLIGGLGDDSYYVASMTWARQRSSPRISCFRSTARPPTGKRARVRQAWRSGRPDR